MNIKKIIKGILIVAMVAVFTTCLSGQVYAKKNYTVTTKKISKIALKTFVNAGNKYTKHSLGLNYYLEKMRKAGGGTLTIKKGTYKISNSIYIPSNVKVIIKDGAVFQKISKTGTNYKPSSSMWQFVQKNKIKKKKSVGKYSGTKNSSIEAQGTVVFDMKYVKGAAIIVAHNSNINVSGITFKGMNGDHYLEVNGSKNVTISNCIFKDAKTSTMKKYYNKEAINIDIPDAGTHGLPLYWVKQDKTPCANITITNSTFDGVNRGIGSHNYSQKGKGNNVYHSNVIVKNNIFKNIYDNGVYILNWKNTTIADNTFYNIGTKGSRTSNGAAHGISGGGVQGINITGNTFNKIGKGSVYFVVKSNQSKDCDYTDISCNITKDQVKAMVNNKSTSCGNDSNGKYNGFDVLFFTGSGQRGYNNVVGVVFATKRIIYGLY